MHQTKKWWFISWIFFLISLSKSSPNILRNNINIITAPQPPDHKQYVEMARFVVHRADWASVATVSNIEKIKGYPFTNIASMSDGPVGKSRGTPYFYLTPLDFAATDLSKDNRCTVSVTLEETDYCRKQNYDPEDPRCARVMLSGKMLRVRNDTAEYEFARDALFSRHPSFIHLPLNHGFFVAKLDIEHIVMLDWFGGPAFIAVDDFLKYNNTKIYDSSFLYSHILNH